MKKLLDLDETRAPRLRAATAWAFYIEGERCFEGTRSLVTYGGIEKPVLNAYRLLARLGRWVKATSSGAWPTVLDTAASLPEEVDVLAAKADNGAVSALVWRHDDDQHRAEPGERPVPGHDPGSGRRAGRGAPVAGSTPPTATRITPGRRSARRMTRTRPRSTR